MPKRKVRTTAAPDADGPALTAAERRGADRLKAYRRRRMLVRVGQLLMGVGIVLAVLHWLAHIGAFGGQPSGLVDLLVGYPTAGLTFLVGAMLAGQKALA